MEKASKLLHLFLKTHKLHSIRAKWICIKKAHMKQLKWFLHPILVFIFSISALGVSLFLYIHWYIEVSSGLKSVIETFNLDKGQILAPETWIVIMVLSLLVGMILMGIFIIFVYNQKTVQLYQLQNNFFNNFTHELKTPVTSLKLFLQTFSKYELTREDQLKYIQFMLTDVNRLSDNISRILNLAKLESKQYKGEFIVCDLSDVMRDFFEENQHLFMNCKIQMHRHEKDAFLYRINKTLFEMLVMNIVTNAEKYNESKTPTIDIFFQSTKHKLKIRFQDNGIGFEKREIQKIFRKFYQIGKADSMTAKGSGLGLHLVQNIAKIHKGKVIAQSDGKGRGSTFTLVLPRKKANQ